MRKIISNSGKHSVIPGNYGIRVDETETPFSILWSLISVPLCYHLLDMNAQWLCLVDIYYIWKDIYHFVMNPLIDIKNDLVWLLPIWQFRNFLKYLLKWKIFIFHILLTVYLLMLETMENQDTSVMLAWVKKV